MQQYKNKTNQNHMVSVFFVLCVEIETLILIVWFHRCALIHNIIYPFWSFCYDF